MTNQQHPITPPLLLVQQWVRASPLLHSDTSWAYELFITQQAAQWGADQELDQCCAWLPNLPPWSADDLRRHRRPTPPSLKELALAELGDAYDKGKIDDTTYDTIRRALEALPE